MGKAWVGTSPAIPSVRICCRTSAAKRQHALVQNALPAYGATVAYRRFWTPQFRTNIAYSYARQEYPSYALEFAPGSASATSLNSQMQQGIVNLIWSPLCDAPQRCR